MALVLPVWLRDREGEGRDSPPPAPSARSPAAPAQVAAATTAAWTRKGRQEGVAPGSGEFPRAGAAVLSAGTGAGAGGCRWALVGLLLAALCLSQTVMWQRAYWGCHCRDGGDTDSSGDSGYSGRAHFTQAAKGTHKSTHKEAGSQILKVIGYEEAKMALPEHHRLRRDLTDVAYVPFSQYMDEMAQMETFVEQKTYHPVSRLVLTQEYEHIHPIDTLVHLDWTAGDGDLFDVTSRNHDIVVKMSGYYYISLTAMFNGRTHLRGPSSIPSCSLRVQAHHAAIRNRAPLRRHQGLVTTLMFVSQTQDNSGISIDGIFPLDTVHASGIFPLRHGDVIRVRPDNWSLGCRIHTDATKTHLDAFLLSSVDMD